MPRNAFSAVFIVALVLSCLSVVSEPLAQNPAPANVENGDLQAQLQLQKTNAKSLALQVIATYKPADPQYIQARQLYTTAQNQYNAFITTLLTNYVAGTKVDLTQTANAAAAANKAFSDYVASLKPQTKSIAALVAAGTALASFAEGIWDWFSGKQTAQRQALANALKPLWIWDDWSKLTVS